MKKVLFALLVMTTSIFSSVEAQKFYTREGHINFFSSTPIEDIEADNYQVSSILNAEDGAYVFSVLMKGFEFEKALMQEHFNEKYLHSDEYPKATFKGAIEDWDSNWLKEDGKKEVTVVGDLTIHGTTKAIKQSGILVIENGELVQGTSEFEIVLEDFDIKIPAVVRENIAEKVKVTVDMEYKLYGSK